MRSVTVRLEDLRTMVLNLGFVGENEHRTFRFDCKKMFGEYPSASVSLAVQPPAGGCYPATVERDGDLVSWTVTDSDLVEAGNGELQLTFMVGDVKAKTCIGRTKVERSLSAPGQIPTPIENWIEQAEEVISEAEDAAEAARDAAEHQPIIDENGYWNTWDAEAEEYVATEVKAQGQDGTPGSDGFSPTATVTKSGKVATISITDKNGTTTETVSDGEDGAPGQDGTDATPDLITVDYADLTFPVAAGTMCYHGGMLYKANQNISTSEEWTAAHWTQTTIEAEQSALKTEINSKFDSLPTEETGQDLLEKEFYNTGLTDTVLMVLGMLFDNMPQDETATDILHSLDLECVRLNAIYELWLEEKEGA